MTCSYCASAAVYWSRLHQRVGWPNLRGALALTDGHMTFLCYTCGRSHPSFKELIACYASSPEVPDHRPVSL